nr:ZAR1 [Ceratophyllum demersum]
MVDAVLSVVLEKVFDFLAEEGRAFTEFGKQFQILKGNLLNIKEFINQVEKTKRNNNDLKETLNKLRDLIYESEDILDDCQSRNQTGKKNGASICFFLKDVQFKLPNSRRLKQINTEISNIQRNLEGFDRTLMRLNEQENNNTVSRWSSPLFIEDQIVGLDDDANKIIKWLQEWDRGYMIGIVGMGGLGKTTIAQIVYKRCEAMYEKRIWVSVSQDFKEKSIMRSILTSLGELSGEDDPSQLHIKIKQCLTGKNYLLVLDDVWKDGQWWENLQKGLPKENGSKIIITSRHEPTVKKMGVNESRIHKPKFLTKDESWSLLKKILTGEHLNPKLIDIGQEIAQRCAGLPLAIKAIGGIMQSRPSIDYWTQIAENFRQELESKDNPIDVSLQLSYNELPPYLKPCFLSFSLYPEDFIIVKDQLLKWWIGEGFTNRRENKKMELAEQYFMELIDRCLIEVVERRYNRKVYTCKIHDMVRDFVIQIAKDEVFYDSNLTETRRLGFPSSVVTDQTHAHPKLRALISTTRIDEVNDIQHCSNFNYHGSLYLRVLDLSKTIFNTKIKVLWSQIEKFRHLTYLSLKSTHPMLEIPASISTLSKLQILDVSYCHSLRRLPASITTLKRLTILDVSNCGSLEYLPKGLGELIHLEVLKGFRPSREDFLEGCQLEELRNHGKLRTLELQITRENQIKYDDDVLFSLKELKFLTISCLNSYGDELVKKIDNLILPTGLYELSLKFFPGEESPSWLSPVCLPNLEFLSISFACFTRMNYRFWGGTDHSWSIVGLQMESLSDLEMTWSEIQNAMPFLKILEARWCPTLNTFPIDDVQFRGGIWRKEE